jgi:hypothetical protein
MTAAARFDRPPEVWALWDLFADTDSAKGRRYIPDALLLVRWLSIRSGLSTGRTARAHGMSKNRATWVLTKLRNAGVAHYDSANRGWWLTELGYDFLQLIDDEGIT